MPWVTKAYCELAEEAFRLVCAAALAWTTMERALCVDGREVAEVTVARDVVVVVVVVVVAAVGDSSSSEDA